LKNEKLFLNILLLTFLKNKKLTYIYGKI